MMAYEPHGDGNEIARVIDSHTGSRGRATDDIREADLQRFADTMKKILDTKDCSIHDRT